MSNINQKTVYANLIAGRLPVGSASPLKVVMNHAYAILGTHRLHAHYVMHANHVYYFAVESRHLSSMPGFVLPFVDVLPDAPLHVGDGAYLVSGTDYCAALILESGSLQYLCNETDVVNDYIAGLDLRVIEVPSQGGRPLRSIPQAIHGVTERFSGGLMKLSSAVLGVSALTFVGAQLANAYTTNVNLNGLNPVAVENDLNATLKKLNVQQPLARQISRIQTVSSTVVRSGGWIEKYSLKGHDNEHFELVLPSWVSQDYIDALGRDVVTDLRDMDGLLIVRKQEKKKG